MPKRQRICPFRLWGDCGCSGTLPTVNVLSAASKQSTVNVENEAAGRLLQQTIPVKALELPVLCEPSTVVLVTRILIILGSDT